LWTLLLQTQTQPTTKTQIYMSNPLRTDGVFCHQGQEIAQNI
jgi:hypothetical protein